MMMNRRLHRQRGTTTVEFAIIGSAALLVMLGIIEMSRMIFVVNALGESTWRGARMAAVCPINDPQIAQTAVFNTNGGTISPLIRGLTTGNIQLEYLDDAGTPITGDLSDQSVFATIEFVRVQVVNFNHDMILPIPIGPIAMPAQAVTLPSESLGIVPASAGGIRPCSLG
jgi:Flp pilus assembly protein TadG